VSEIREEVHEAMAQASRPRLMALLDGLGVARSSWYRTPVAEEQRKAPGPAPRPLPDEVVRWVLAMARSNPWYGYKKIAILCRRADQRVKNRQAYRVMAEFGLLHKPICRKAELYQAAKLFELLPNGPNELWQMDVTYVHIPGFGWRYAITVIDYYSRYLLAAYLTDSYSAAEAVRALGLARAEAEGLFGPLAKRPFLLTDNGPSFIARRFGAYLKDVFAHVRIQYRTPTQLGLLERFHRTLKQEELYWRSPRRPGALPAMPGRVPAAIQRGAAALGPGAGGRRRPGDAAGRVRRRRADAASEVARLGEGGQGEAGQVDGGGGVSSGGGRTRQQATSGSASALELRGAAPSAPSPRRRPIALSGHPWGEGDAEATELQGLAGPGIVANAIGRKPNTKQRQKIPLELRAKTWSPSL